MNQILVITFQEPAPLVVQETETALVPALPECQFCGLNPATRPRLLCWPCYALYHIREQFDTEPPYKRARKEICDALFAGYNCAMELRYRRSIGLVEYVH